MFHMDGLFRLSKLTVSYVCLQLTLSDFFRSIKGRVAWSLVALLSGLSLMFERITCRRSLVESPMLLSPISLSLAWPWFLNCPLLAGLPWKFQHLSWVQLIFLQCVALHPYLNSRCTRSIFFFVTVGIRESSPLVRKSVFSPSFVFLYHYLLTGLLNEIPKKNIEWWMGQVIKVWLQRWSYSWPILEKWKGASHHQPFAYVRS